ncbi:MAG: hypothetical protein E3J72_01905 [Planctomycetota bacterium]|nr:MAG: hypothetical protein E3J72_01905 [Planctomycetota bacterium]
MIIRFIIPTSPILIYLTLWLLHAGRTTFVLLRSEKTEREKELYTKESVIHTYLYLSMLVILIMIIMTTEHKPFGREILGQILVMLAKVIAFGVMPLTAAAGFFIQKIKYGKVLSLLFFPMAAYIFWLLS